jgi:choline-sulfatase
VAAAEELDLLHGTRVLYSSDHGEMLGAKGLFGKSCLYEDSVGVPLILAGPGVPAGATVAQPVSHVDLFPTILDGAGVALASDDRHLPGKSPSDEQSGWSRRHLKAVPIRTDPLS